MTLIDVICPYLGVQVAKCAIDGDPEQGLKFYDMSMTSSAEDEQ